MVIVIIITVTISIIIISSSSSSSIINIISIITIIISSSSSSPHSRGTRCRRACPEPASCASLLISVRALCFSFVSANEPAFLSREQGPSAPGLFTGD